MLVTLTNYGFDCISLDFCIKLGTAVGRKPKGPVEVRPSIVMTYSVHRNGDGLSRDSQAINAPGDYGLHATGQNICDLNRTGNPNITVSSNQFVSSETK